MAKAADTEPRYPILSEEDRLALGQRLADLRKKSGRSQRQLSRETAIASSRLSRIERGRFLSSLEELARLRAVLGFDLEEIVFGRSAASSFGRLGRLARVLEDLGDPADVRVAERVMQCLIQDKASGGENLLSREERDETPDA